MNALRRYRRSSVPLFAGSVLIASCSFGANDEVTADYVDVAELGFIDQTVFLEHGAGNDVIPTMEYTPLDESGDEVPGVDVSTIYGSDRGQLVVTPDGEIDILVFSGERVTDVVDVRSAAVESEVLETRGSPLEEQPLAIADGVEVTKSDVFDAVELSNNSSVDRALRVVCILWNRPAPGEAQQAAQVDVVVERVMVPAGATVVADASAAFIERTDALGFGCESLKAHLTPLSG